jgi:hypothetical protein
MVFGRKRLRVRRANRWDIRFYSKFVDQDAGLPDVAGRRGRGIRNGTDSEGTSGAEPCGYRQMIPVTGWLSGVGSPE